MPPSSPVRLPGVTSTGGYPVASPEWRASPVEAPARTAPHHALAPAPPCPTLPPAWLGVTGPAPRGRRPLGCRRGERGDMTRQRGTLPPVVSAVVRLHLYARDRRP